MFGEVVMFSYLLTFILAAMFALIFTPVAIFLAKKWDVLDYPGERRVHTVPIPRFGGIAIYFSFWLAVLFSIQFDKMIVGIFLGSTIILIVGIVDDIKGVRPLYKLAWQLLAAIVLIFFGLAVKQITLPLFNTINLGIIGYAFAVFWIVGLVNTVNISDGLDGLAAGICFIAALILFWSAYRIGHASASYLMLALAGAALGFLFYNFHPAKIFMGDSGSMFLGYIIGAVSIWGLLKTATILGLVFPLLVLGMPLTDLVFAIIRRSWKGMSIVRADRGHLHHRLLDVGLTQRQAVLILYAISFCFGLAAILSVYGNWYIALGLILLNVGVILRIMFRRFYLVKNNDKKRIYFKNRGNE
jgi:UDP-GlcNAc:undecaprenyl-phosphate GlcNAc-1-phosphate transferase